MKRKKKGEVEKERLCEKDVKKYVSEKKRIPKKKEEEHFGR